MDPRTKMEKRGRLKRRRRKENDVRGSARARARPGGDKWFTAVCDSLLGLKTELRRDRRRERERNIPAVELMGHRQRDDCPLLLHFVSLKTWKKKSVVTKMITVVPAVLLDYSFGPIQKWLAPVVTEIQSKSPFWKRDKATRLLKRSKQLEEENKKRDKYQTVQKCFY
jgi:hypothetical protein